MYFANVFLNPLVFLVRINQLIPLFSISIKAVDRILSGTVTLNREVMEYEEFVWFILSEEDKGTLTAAEYWFRIMDRDGDGIITLEDLEFFYKEQVKIVKTNTNT